MPTKPHTWISLWFLITAPIIIWDVGYCLMRPRSFDGGDLHWIWKPYGLYQEIDLVYGVEAYKNGDGFANASSLLNIIETLLSLVYLYLAHASDSAVAPIIGFTGATMTLSKTILYLAQEYYCNYCAVGHNTSQDLLAYYIIPNSFWIIFPASIVWTLGKDIVQKLHAADVMTKVKKSK